MGEENWYLAPPRPGLREEQGGEGKTNQNHLDKTKAEGISSEGFYDLFLGLWARAFELAPRSQGNHTLTPNLRFGGSQQERQRAYVRSGRQKEFLPMHDP